MKRSKVKVFGSRDLVMPQCQFLTAVHVNSNAFLKALTVNVLLQDQGDQGGRGDQGVRACRLFHRGQEDPVRQYEERLNE